MFGHEEDRRVEQSGGKLRGKQLEDKILVGVGQQRHGEECQGDAVVDHHQRRIDLVGTQKARAEESMLLVIIYYSASSDWKCNTKSNAPLGRGP